MVTVAFDALLRFLLPDWLVAWIAVAAVVAFLLNFRKTALMLAMIPVGRWIVMPMLKTVVLPLLPDWVPIAAAVAAGIAIAVIGPGRILRALANTARARAKKLRR